MTSTPCKAFGHTEGRYKNGYCVGCNRMRLAARCVAHKEEIKAAHAAYYAAHRERIKADRATYYATLREDPERSANHLRSLADWRQNHPGYNRERAYTKLLEEAQQR